MLFVTVTGIDKSGKSTLIDKFMKSTNYKHYVVDRDPSTFHFFNLLRCRVESKEQLLEYSIFQEKFNRIVDLAILLKVDESDWIERCKKHNEPELVGNLSMTQHQMSIEKYFHIANYKNTLTINTSIYTVEECINLIKGKINACK